MPTIECNQQHITFDQPVTVAQALARLLPESHDKPLGAFCEGRVLELGSRLTQDTTLRPITFQDEEGRRIYERSLRFILLLAVHRCYPDVRVRIGFGMYLQLVGRRVVQGDAKLIEDTMREIVAANLPFKRSRWSRQQAIDYFTRLGWTDKAALLSYRPYDYFNIYECGGLAEYFYGAMLPGTGDVPVFSLRYYPPGLILQMPAPNDPAVPAPYVSRPKHMSTFFESNYWCQMHPVLISMDNFYLNRPDVPLDEHGKPDLESLYALDIELFRHCIRDLLDGKTAQLPEYDFATGMRKEKSIPLRISHDQMLIIEGIHGLNPELHKGFEPGEICKFYLSELTCLNLDDHNRIRTTDARLLRRIVRDYQFRGTTPEKTLAMWDSVRRGEEKWIFPYQEQADIVFNTALHYELPVLRRYAYDMLQRITPDEPDYFRANRLIKILNYFLPAPDDAMQEIPPLSILREFIGGNTFYNE